MDRKSEPVEGQSSDPYEDLASVFDEPIILEDPELELDLPEEPPAPEPPPPPVEAPSRPAPSSGDQGPSSVTDRLASLEAEIRAGSERTLEAVRRLGERMASELAMLDKRAINLELTLARLRSIVESGSRKAEPPKATPPSADDDR